MAEKLKILPNENIQRDREIKWARDREQNACKHCSQNTKKGKAQTIPYERGKILQKKYLSTNCHKERIIKDQKYTENEKKTVWVSCTLYKYRHRHRTYVQRIFTYIIDTWGMKPLFSGIRYSAFDSFSMQWLNNKQLHILNVLIVIIR